MNFGACKLQKAFKGRPGIILYSLLTNFSYSSVKKKFQKLKDSQNRLKMTFLEWGVDGFRYFH